ncbi:MAG: hypothetical protein WC783_00950 [Candidatus Paceibacterota bacterium]|jgi:hypothetical protein
MPKKKNSKIVKTNNTKSKATSQPIKTSIEVGKVYQGKPRSKKARVTGEPDKKKRASKYVVASTMGYNNQSGNTTYTSPDYYHPQLTPQQLLLPKSRREKNLWARTFYENDPVVASAIDFHSELPLSRLRLEMPQCKDPRQAKTVYNFFEHLCDEIDLFSFLLDLSHEWYLLGNVFPYAEFDEKRKVWSNIFLLDPDDIVVTPYPFTNFEKIELVIPGQIRDLLNSDDSAEIMEHIPDEIISFVESGENIPLNTDPFEGSHVAHLARKRSQYRDMGSSILERVFKLLIYKDRLRNAQDAIAQRNMTAKHKINAPNVGLDVIDALTEQVYQSFEDPDQAVITNFDFGWDLIGAAERILPLQAEFEQIDGEIYTGLGLTKGLITGEQNYGSSNLIREVLLTKYTLFRERIAQYVQNNLFKPIARINNFIETNEFGEEVEIIPKLGFSRINLRDNEEAFGNLFNLYSKGSLDVSTILELYNIDPVEVNNRLKEDMFTINDSTFNELLRTVYQEIGRDLINTSDITDRVQTYLGLEKKLPVPGGGEEEPK